MIFALQTRKNRVSSIHIQNGVAFFFIYFRLLTVPFDFWVLYRFFQRKKDENLWCQTWWPAQPWSNFFKVFNSDRTERWCCCVVALWGNKFTNVPRQLIYIYYCLVFTTFWKKTCRFKNQFSLQCVLMVDGVVRYYTSFHPKGHPHDAFRAIFWVSKLGSDIRNSMYNFKWYGSVDLLWHYTSSVVRFLDTGYLHIVIMT